MAELGDPVEGKSDSSLSPAPSEHAHPQVALSANRLSKSYHGTRTTKRKRAKRDPSRTKDKQRGSAYKASSKHIATRISARHTSTDSCYPSRSIVPAAGESSRPFVTTDMQSSEGPKRERKAKDLFDPSAFLSSSPSSSSKRPRLSKPASIIIKKYSKRKAESHPTFTCSSQGETESPCAPRNDPHTSRRPKRGEAEGVKDNEDAVHYSTLPETQGKRRKKQTQLAVKWSSKMLAMLRLEPGNEGTPRPMNDMREPVAYRPLPPVITCPTPGPSTTRRKVLPKPKAEATDSTDPCPISPLGAAMKAELSRRIPEDHPLRSLPSGIASSRFCRVLRLVADLAPPRNVRRPKCEPLAARPPVWAESRQELCEALPYYRAFQSGLYMFNRVAFGYLLEAFPAPRDLWAQNGRIVISHGGGQCVRTIDNFGRKGEPALAADQSDTDARVDTLLQAHRNGTPLILIAGEGYQGLSWKLDCAYAVLGWYWISAMWVEAEPTAEGIVPPDDRNYFHRYKVRFDWVQSQSTPWWETSTSVPARQCSHAAPPSPSSTLKEAQSVANSAKHPPTGLPTPPITPPDRNNGVSARDFPSGHSLAKVSQGTVSLSAMRDSEIAAEPMSSNSIHERYDTPHEVEAADLHGKGQLFSRPKRKAPGDSLLVDQEVVATSSVKWSACSTISAICPTCFESFPGIYQEGWICFNRSCPQFWLLDTKIGLMPIPPGFDLTYSELWLTSPDTPAGTKSLPYDIRPPPPASALSEVEECAGDRTLWKGWVCEDCGRANCRYRWEVWECRNCGRLRSPLDAHKIITASELDQHSESLLGNAYVHPAAGIRVSLRQVAEPVGILVSYTLPQSSGTIHHLHPSDRSSADDVWEMYQYQAATTEKPLFERRALRCGTVKGQLLAQHFAVNSGVKYKYNVDSASLTFEESPECVRIARQMINDNVNSCLMRDSPVPVNFNEVLSVMYREGQKMSWHDDSEEGLGPVVASLSLGSQALMEWRPKIDRVQLNTGYYLGHEGKKKDWKPDTALRLTLSHGDIIIMEGEKIQMRYSHRVVPHGYRVAATAREIAG